MTKLGAKRTTPKKPIKKKLPKLYVLDSLFSKYIRDRAGNKCEYCGREKGVMNCSHFIGRRYRNTRFKPSNAACLCYSCHNFMHDFPNLHRDWFIKRIGSEELERNEILARSLNKVDLQEVKERLTK